MKRLLIVCIGLMILAEGCTMELYGDRCPDWVAVYEDRVYVEAQESSAEALEARKTGHCPDKYICTLNSEKERVCRTECDETSTLCNEKCMNNKEYTFSFTEYDGLKYCVATETGADKCPDKCVNGCNDDGSCKPLEGCQNGVNDDGTCRCPDECANGCDETGSTCTCPSSCVGGCNDIGSQCTCAASCVDGSSCDTTTGKCKCIDRCKFGCDATGTCAEVCENVKCDGENEQCQAVEKESKIEAVCVDLCEGVKCKDDEYCKMGDCYFWDKNNNHLHDKYETAAKQGQSCRKYKDCNSSAGAVDGFCDSFLNYTCSTKCTDDSQCVDDGEFHYICRADGRCAPDSFVTVWKLPPKGTNDITDYKLQLRIPTSTATACDFTIDWGDGSKSEKCVKESKDDTIYCDKQGNNTLINNGDLLHTYQVHGFVTVKITGQYDGFGWPTSDEYYFDQDGENVYVYQYSNLDNSPTKLFEVKSYGPVGLGPFAFAFASTNTSSVSSISKVDIPDASKMQDMRYTFYYSYKYNLPIENWDMSHVVDMRGMFKYASNFNQPLDHWDTSSVKWMGNKGDDVEMPHGVLSDGVFSHANAFNQPLEHWDTSNVVSLSTMFKNATAFNGAVNDWETSKVMFMYGIFQFTDSFDQPLDHWDTSNVTDMRYAFNEAKAFNQSLDTWNTSNVENMSNMFNGAIKFNGTIGSWNTSKVEDMSGMFQMAESFNQSINQWTVYDVTNMHGMFSSAKAFNQPLDNWYPGQVTDMSNMFSGATTFNQKVFRDDSTHWPVTNMSGMFNDATSFNQSVKHWNVSNVTNMYGLFQGAASFNQPLDAWATKLKKVTSMSSMFNGATAFDQDLSSWQFGKKVTVTNIFKNTKLAKDSSNIYCKIFNAWKGNISATTCADLGMAGCSCE